MLNIHYNRNDYNKNDINYFNVLDYNIKPKLSEKLILIINTIEKFI